MRILIAVALAACGGARNPAASVDNASARNGSGDDAGERTVPRGPRASREDTFGPLEVGADYEHYAKLTPQPFRSLDHGNRWVDVYVNDVGAAAYESGGEIPVGTIIVKTSWITEGGRPSNVAGPTFVMEKRAPGYAPTHGDWWYAIHWATPPAADVKKFGGPIYWRGESPRVQYCWSCHDDYDRSLGGLIPSSILKR